MWHPASKNLLRLEAFRSWVPSPQMPYFKQSTGHTHTTHTTKTKTTQNSNTPKHSHTHKTHTHSTTNDNGLVVAVVSRRRPQDRRRCRCHILNNQQVTRSHILKQSTGHTHTTHTTKTKTTQAAGNRQQDSKTLTHTQDTLTQRRATTA